MLIIISILKKDWKKKHSAKAMALMSFKTFTLIVCNREIEVQEKPKTEGVGRKIPSLVAGNHSREGWSCPKKYHGESKIHLKVVYIYESDICFQRRLIETSSEGEV